MGVLNILAATPGPHTSVMLAELLGVSKPMITAYLTALSEKGYITKEQSRDDKRVYHVLPTAKAMRLVGHTRAETNAHLADLVSAPGLEDFDLLVRLTQKANQALEAKHPKTNGHKPLNFEEGQTMDLNDKIWNPWHGCHKCSEGYQNCYAYFLDKRYGRGTSEVVKNKSDFTLPIKKDRSGNRKLPSGSFCPRLHGQRLLSGGGRPMAH